MKTKVLLFLLFTLTAFAIGTVVTLLFNTAPTSKEIIALFYISLFATIFGLVFFTIYSFFYLRLQAIPPWLSTVSAIRLGVVTAGLITVLLAVRSVEMLNTATFVILVVLAGVAELLLRRKTMMKKSS